MMKDEGVELDALLGELRKLCAKLPGSEEYIMVHHPAFRVGKKPFAIAGMQQHEKGATLSVNLGRDAQVALLGDARFTKTPYIGQHGWITIARDDVKKGELSELVIESWRRIANLKRIAEFEGASAAPARATPATTKKQKTKH